MQWVRSTRRRALLCNWDPSLVLLAELLKVEEIGKGFRQTLVSMLSLALVVLLIRSTDLTGVAMAETIKGIQDAGVIACAKHFIGNEQVRSYPFARHWN
jgi:hypothetical protein